MQPYQYYRQFTREFPELQGLRKIPFGLLILVLGMQRLNLPWLGRQGDFTLIIPLFILMFVAWVFIGRYYTNKFGKVEPLERSHTWKWASTILLVLFIGVIILENILYRQHTPLPISLTEFVFGLLVLITGLQNRRWYYILSGLVILTASLLPFFSLQGVGDPLFGTFGIVFDIVFAACVFLVGVFDHLRLVHSYATIEGDDLVKSE